jgi:CubicO group peptidase (beta-lactamase class C family)
VSFAYDAALQQRVLSPIGMKRSTFDPEAVRADGDYALPHAADLSGDQRPIPLEAEHDVLLPVRPAGGLWSTARAMARFVQTELAGGIAPSGTRVVSAANLGRPGRRGWRFRISMAARRRWPRRCQTMESAG